MTLNRLVILAVVAENRPESRPGLEPTTLRCETGKCEELMLAGLVEVDGEVVTRLGTKVDPSTAVIRVEGRDIGSVVWPQCRLILAMRFGTVPTKVRSGIPGSEARALPARTSAESGQCCDTPHASMP